jgi:hypothetical protein
MMGQQNHLTDDTSIYGSIKSIWYKKQFSTLSFHLVLY